MSTKQTVQDLLNNGEGGYLDADRYLKTTGRIEEIIDRGGGKLGLGEAI